MPTGFRRNTVTSYLNTVSSLVVALVSVPVLTRGLGDSEYGIWILVGSFVLYLELFEFGFGSTTIRYVAGALARGDQQEARVAVATSFWLLAVPGVAALFLGVGLAAAFPHLFDLDPALVTPTQVLLVLLAFDLALSIPSDTFGGVLVAAQRFDLLNTTLIVTSLAQLAGIGIVISAGGDLVALGITTIALSLLGQLSRFVLARRIVPDLSVSPSLVRRSLLRPYAGASVWFFVQEISVVVIQRIDALVVGAVSGVASAGVYGVGQKLALLGDRLVDPAIAVFFPHAAGLAAQDDREGLRAATRTACRIAVGVALPPCLVIALLAAPALDAWVGDDFHEARLVVVYLAAATALSAMRKPAQLVLNGVGALRTPALLNAVEAAANLVLSIVLCHTMGLVGVALATLISSGTVTVLLFMPFAARAIGLSLPTLVGDLLRAHLLPLAVVGALGAVLLEVGVSGVLPLLGSGAGLALAYVVVLAFTGFRPEERAVVRARLRRS
jgi:O-antigen/teichoic acid export membrane protein